MAKYDTMQKGLTFQLIKMSDTQTQIKRRFSGVYYPPEVEAYYKIVWQAVDKQIFVGQNVEGSVEKRNWRMLAVTNPSGLTRERSSLAFS